MSRAVDEFCPACGVTPGQTCRNLATGQPMYRDGRPVTHPARSEETWRNPALLSRRGQLREANPDLYSVTG